MLPMWASYIVKAYAPDAIAGERWRRSVVFKPLWAGAGTVGAAFAACGGRQHAFYVWTWAVSGVRLYLAAVYDPADSGRAGAPAAVAVAGVGGLGAHPHQTFRYVVLPLAIPGVAAGSIFTFSLTLGDFIVPQLVGPPGYFIGNMVYSQQGAIGNMPMAAAFTLVPIVLIAVYLAFVKRTGSL